MNKQDIQQIIDTAHYWQDRTLEILAILNNRLIEAKDKEDKTKVMILESIIEEIIGE